MEVLDAILDYLEAQDYPKSASLLRKHLRSLDTLAATEASARLLTQLNAYLHKENRPVSGSEKQLDPESEEIMESLLSRLVNASTVSEHPVVKANLDSLFEIKAFQKMVSHADQLFYDAESMNISSRILDKQKGDSSVSQIEDQSLSALQDPSSSAKSGLSKAEVRAKVSDSAEPSVVSVKSAVEGKNASFSSISLLGDNVDEYQDDDDPGFDVFQCDIQDVEVVSQQLADKYNFPARASRPSNPPNPVEKDTEESQEAVDLSQDHKKVSNLPANLRFPDSHDKFYPKEYEGVMFDCFDLKVVYDREKTGFEESKDFPIVPNTLVAGRYRVVEYLGSAAFSKAIQCVDETTGQHVCLKIIENNKDYFDQSIDEIKVLEYVNVNGDCDEHHVLKSIDCFYHKEHLILVTELLRDNLYEFSRYNRENEEELYFTLGRIQRVTFQVLQALDYIHSLHLIHCDLKPENILIKSYSRCEVKVIDFGSSCFIHDHLSSYVQSRSYRSPEVILGCKYDYKIDMWSLGCIVAELWTGNVLFQNETVQGLLARVISIVGPFPEDMFRTGRLVHKFFTADRILYQESRDDEADPDESKPRKSKGNQVQLLIPKRTTLKARLRTDDEVFISFVRSLLELDTSKRPTAKEALKHPFICEAKYQDGL